MATVLQIKHNPFLVETEITINGQEPAENSALSQYRKQRLQLWIDKLFDDLSDIFNGETQYEVAFHGVPSDCNDMEAAVAEANARGFNIQLNCTQAENGEIRLQKIQEIMHQMEHDELFSKYIADNLDVRTNFQAAFDRDFDVYVVATMSSGKSTLINSLMGCSMLPALNEATTATIARITDNDQTPQGHFSVKRLNKQGDVLDFNDHLVFDNKESADNSLAVLSAWNKQEDTFRIDITGNIIGIRERDNVRLVLSDTPGPNNSQDKEHALATMHHIRDSKRNPLILYILNSRQLRTNDDKTLLQDIATEIKKIGKQNRDRFIFVLNQADALDPDKGENIEGVVERAKKYLHEEIGIENPMIYPVSALLALLLRKSELNRDLLTLKERGDLYALESWFTEDESMDMVKHMPLNYSVQATLKQKSFPIALYRSGIPAIEAMIDDYINKYNVPHRVTRAYQALEKILAQSINEAELKKNLDMKEEEVCNLQIQINQLNQKREKGFAKDAFLSKLKKEKRGLSEMQKNILRKFENKIRKILNKFQEDLISKVNLSKIEAERILNSVHRDMAYEYNHIIIELDNSMKEAQQEIIAELNRQYQQYVQGLLTDFNYLNLPILDNFKNKVNSFNGNVFVLSSSDIKIKTSKVKDGGHWESTTKWWNPFSWFNDDEWVDHYRTIEEEKVDLAKFWKKNSDNIREEFNRNIVLAKEQMEIDSNILLDSFVQFMEAQFVPQFENLLQDLQDKINNKKEREQAIQEGKEQLKSIQVFRNQLDALLNV